MKNETLVEKFDRFIGDGWLSYMIYNILFLVTIITIVTIGLSI